MKKLFKAAPEEQVVGYSVQELKSIFEEVLNLVVPGNVSYPAFSSLGPAGIQACYSCFLMDKAEAANLQRLINEKFSAVDERTLNGLTVTRFKYQLKNEQLIFSISNREFNGATIRLVTNSSEVLTFLNEGKFAVPPPWIAFEGYEPSWWGGSMQGTQGFYSDNYFLPFFSSLNPAEKSDYYQRYSASEEWITALELTQDH